MSATPPKRPSISSKEPNSLAAPSSKTEETVSEPVKRRLSIKKKMPSSVDSPASTAPSSPTSTTAPTSFDESATTTKKRLSIKKPPSSIPEEPQPNLASTAKTEMAKPKEPALAETAPEQTKIEVETGKKKISVKKKTSGMANGTVPKATEITPPQIVTDESVKVETSTSVEGKQPKIGGRPKRIPSIEVSNEQTDDSKQPTVVIEPDSGLSGSSASLLDRRDSIESPNPSRSGSRRPSIIIVADEKGLAVDESGQTKKLRPGEMLEVRRGSRRGSVMDMRRTSTVEIDRADKPSTPLKEMGETGPPVITDYVENVSAVDGKTAFIQATVEGKPLPKFKFYKDAQEIFEGGRYTIQTDGETNTVYFCIRKAKSQDEGKYKIVAYNEHGEDSCNIKLFVSGKFFPHIIYEINNFIDFKDESGMDFRAMLKSKQYAKWGKDKEDPDWGNLKATEDERRASLRDTKVNKTISFFPLYFVLLCLLYFFNI